YLFLCPFEDLQTSDGTCFRHPDIPAYWSLDPSGVERLTTETSRKLGFPSLALTRGIFGISWNKPIYLALRQFYKAKGFDPESQDIARVLRYPLYRLSSERDTSFAHCEHSHNDY
ncbi:hypothetical protein B0H10DRAFT_1800877, partial [Mycena sp. CBHHK59/15]